MLNEHLECVVHQLERIGDQLEMVSGKFKDQGYIRTGDILSD